jgi:hypothetical protein
MKRLALALAAFVLAASAAEAKRSPYGPIHIERQRGSILTIEHTPVPRRVVRWVVRKKVAVHHVRRSKVVVRRKVRRWAVARSEFVRNPAIAGDCREGGYVRRHVGGYGPVTLQREVCEGIAPVSSLPPDMAYVPQFISIPPAPPPQKRVIRARY